MSRLYFTTSYSILIGLIGSLPAWGSPSPQTEIHVTLLGQPCLLQGSVGESTIKAIHSIGPAQLYPNLSSPDEHNALSDARRALDSIQNIRKNFNLSSFNLYLDKVDKRIRDQIDFIEGWDALKRTHKAEGLLAVGKRHLQGRTLESYENLVKKIPTDESKRNVARDLAEQLFDLYNDNIEPDPQDLFQAAIKKMGIRYQCSFGEGDDSGGEE